MKNKTFRYLFLLLLIVFFVHIYSMIYVEHLKAWPETGMGMMSSISYFSMKHFATLLINIVMGTLFGLESLLRHMRIQGKWHINIRKLLLLGIPLLLLSIEYFNFILLNDLLRLGNRYLLVPAREPFFRFMLGYVIITSFHKD
ncbi:hypothetical protein AN1V17_32260 [Vallitalea sediminicola]